MKSFSEKVNDIESEIFSLVYTVSNLKDKYQKGILNDYFFRKAIKNVMNNLLNINVTIKRNNMMLSTILNNMNFKEEYYKSIDIINSLSSFNFEDAVPSKSEKLMRDSILTLPAITAKIASSFITLLDALHLEGLKDTELILNLFRELNKNLARFPDLEKKILQLYKHCKKNSRMLIQSKTYRDKVGDHLYEIYKEFQMILNLHQ